MLTILLAASLMGAQETHPEPCTRTAARLYEVSGEPAVDVAQAVALVCEDKSVPPVDSLFWRMSLEQQKQARDLKRELTRNEALVYVMGLRTCRKTIGCKLSSIP